jgi:hypothetical protein
VSDLTPQELAEARGLKMFTTRLAVVVDAEKDRSMHLPGVCLLASVVAKANGLPFAEFVKLCADAYNIGKLQ